VQFVTLAGRVLDRVSASTGLKDTSFGPFLSGSTTVHQGWAMGPAGGAFAAVLDPSVDKIVISGTSGNDFLAARFEEDGMSLDSTFGQNGVIKIDFGSTSGILTDGGRSVVMRTLDGGTTYDILVAGYTYDSTTAKFKIALVDLLDDNTFDVS
jgi:hypothetical protein